MWEQIRSNQRRSVALVIGIGAILLSLGFLIGWYFGNGIVGLIIALIIWGIMNLVAFSQGDSILLSISKARKVRREDYPRLYNIVDEMRIASGLEHTPDVYIIDDPALNAFATGRNPKRASLAVTSGLLEKLNRDELQGVIGHEIAHIKNRDVFLMVMCGILVGSIVMLAWFFSRTLIYGGAPRTRRSSSSGDSGGLLILIVAIVLIVIAPLAAQLIYFALSRRREYLADASSALYTRYPEGLASALEKIAGSTLEVRSANKATAPMFIINPFRKEHMAATDLTSTHPPISERIRILRSMAGASFVDYEEAYRKLHGSRKGIMPNSALAQTQTVETRPPNPEPLGSVKGSIENTRNVSDLLWRVHDYKTVTCECGTRLRIPPKLQKALVRCPHCGRINTV